jgi:hypothetical protein
MHYQPFLESSRKFRSKLFEPLGRFLLKFKISANLMTFISFVFGLTTVYFLFQNYFLFILFASLHLLADGFDGILARLTQTTLHGKYFDFLTDRTITLLILAKMYFYLQDYYLVLVILLFFLSQIIHLLSDFTYPIIFFRTGGLLFLSLYPLFPAIPFLTFGYLVAGIFSLYILLRQLKHFLRIKMT